MSPEVAQPNIWKLQHILAQNQHYFFGTIIDFEFRMEGRGRGQASPERQEVSMEFKILAQN